MTIRVMLVSLCAVGGLSGPALGQDADVIKSAESAAPAAIASGATIYGFDESGMLMTVREGTNGWWCMGDYPASPGPDPMCGDANALEWAQAWMTKTDPPAGKVGFIYMLSGGSDSSNTDPYAAGPEEGNHWVTTGPHVQPPTCPSRGEQSCPTWPLRPTPMRAPTSSSSGAKASPSSP